MPLMLRQRFFAVMDDLAGFVVGDLLEIAIVVPINDALPMH
jgi:hypothetical protein